MKHNRPVVPTQNKVKDLLGLSYDTCFCEQDLLGCMDVLIWNCRGAGNKSFRRNFTDLFMKHKPSIVALLETKVKLDTMGTFFKKLGLKGSLHIDPMGRVGGIWILWDPDFISLNPTKITDQVIHVNVKKDDFDEWVFSAVYGSPNQVTRNQLWEELIDRATSNTGPWLVAGDFNDTATVNESQGSTSAVRTSQLANFRDRMDRCNLVDMGAEGPKFTWSNGRKGMALIRKRLDRALCNSDWSSLFPEGMVRILPRTYSDHAPVLIHTLRIASRGRTKRPFRFEAAWLLDPRFHDVAKNSWLGNNFADKIISLTNKVSKWNKESFGNIFRKKKWILGRIEGIQRAQSNQPMHSLQCLEKDLIADYNNILNQEELLWFQKSRSKWLVEGDRNTKFFHLSTIIRRRRLKVTALKNDNNAWIEDPHEIGNMVKSYFCNLYSRQEISGPSIFEPIPHPVLDGEDNNTLCLPITNADVWNHVKQIKAYKAPGPDGLQAVFYHNCWDIVGEDVCNLVRDCFTSRNVPSEINRTYIALIPKIDCPQQVNQFRPISLCNVAYKIITKIMVSRLRPLLGKIIGPCQSSFIPGRSTSDNIIITQEILHTLRRKKGKKGDMVFKIDLEKAYDKVSWDFLKDTLHYFNFCDEWINMTMSCVSNFRTAVLWNGEPLEDFTPQRGLRQGDPLSPYLFVLCMERLSVIINSKVQDGSWKGIKVSRNAPQLSHLFFADDLILFGEASTKNCSTITNVLNDFCCMSGQTISFAKSKMYVSNNVPVELARNMSNSCGIPLTNNLGRYLGIPLIHGRTKKDLFDKIISDMQNKLSKWKSLTLPFAGRITLTQAVTSTIASYTMQTMDLPVSVCDKIDKINRNFVWGDMEDKKRMHLVGWHKICKPKDNGGLGIRRAKDQNLALLTKLGWKVATNEDALWVKLLRFKYLGSHSLFSWPSRIPASHTWRAIVKTGPILRKGMKWSVGKGDKIHVWKDWWCGKGPLEHYYPGLHTSDNTHVSDLIDTNGTWNLSSISNIIDNATANDIMSIHIPQFANTDDQLQWSISGKFTTAAAYDIVAEVDQNIKGWLWWWKLKLPAKFKTFFWLIMHNSLATNNLRAERGSSVSNLCPRCNSDPETIDHLFRKCCKASTLWAKVRDFRWVRRNWNIPFKDWFLRNLKSSKSYGYAQDIPWFIAFATTLWQIWKDRNKKSFDNIVVDETYSLSGIYHYAKEIKEAFNSPSIHNPHTLATLLYWKFPIAGKVKLNVDGCWYDADMVNRAGFGGIFRDCVGAWILGFYGKCNTPTCHEAELKAIYEGLKIIREKGIAYVDLESDSLWAVNAINREEPPQMCPAMVEDIKALVRMTGTKVSHASRQANQCADALARMGAVQEESLVVTYDMPMNIIQLVREDILGGNNPLD